MFVPVAIDEWYGFEDDALHHIYFRKYFAGIDPIQPLR